MKPAETEPKASVFGNAKSLLMAGLSSGAMSGSNEHGAGEKWGDYEIIQKISSGGMGMVYLAWQGCLERFVALKFLLPELVGNDQFVERFRREAKAAASLSHPNIVSVHEVGELDGQVFFSMDFIEGRNLAEIIKEGPIPWRQAVEYCKGIAEAIDYAHSRWVLHRDLKPSNVLIDLNNRPKVTDFGLAGKMEVRTHLTLTNHILGSPSYLSPEQASGKVDDVTVASDIHAIGVILYECLTGHPPYRGDSLQETLLKVREQEPVPFRVMGFSLPRDLETICLKCLEKEPARRYVTARELADDLTSCLNGEAISAKPPTWFGRVARSIKKHPRIALVCSLGVTMSLLLVGYLTLQNSRLFSEKERMERVVKEKEKTLSKAYLDLAEKYREDKMHEEEAEYLGKAAVLSNMER